MAFSVNKSNRYYAPDRASWRQWLLENHASSAGIWLVYYKMGSGKTRVEYADAVEEALCFGWIDSTLNPIDEFCYMQLYTPRKAKSGWSKLNKERVEKLEAVGLMYPAGLKMVELAKQTGTWNHLDHVETYNEPEILTRALDKEPECRAFFEQLSNTNRKYVLYRLHNAKRLETRQLRLAEIMEAFRQGKLPDRMIPSTRKKKTDNE